MHVEFRTNQRDSKLIFTLSMPERTLRYLHKGIILRINARGRERFSVEEMELDLEGLDQEVIKVTLYGVNLDR